MKVYLSTNYKSFNPVQKALNQTSYDLDIEIFQADYFNIEEQIVPQIISTIKNVDVVIADVSNDSPNIYYEIGISHSLGKPVVLVSMTDNFNKISLLSNRYFMYEDSERGIKNLSFRLEKILSNNEEINSLKPLSRKKIIFDYIENTKKNQLNEIVKISGVSRYYKLEKWIFELLNSMPDFEVQYNKERGGKEYDFIIWNSNDSEELRGLGNPIPIEVKATSTIENNLIHSLTRKASSQGFKSFILITTAILSDRNKKLIKNLKDNSGIAILVIDKEELREIYSSKDFVKSLIRSFRKYFVY